MGETGLLLSGERIGDKGASQPNGSFIGARSTCRAMPCTCRVLFVSSVRCFDWGLESVVDDDGCMNLVEGFWRGLVGRWHACLLADHQHVRVQWMPAWTRNGALIPNDRIRYDEMGWVIGPGPTRPPSERPPCTIYPNCRPDARMGTLDNISLIETPARLARRHDWRHSILE